MSSKNPRINKKKIGVIFDLDGVIVNNGRFHSKAWQAFYRNCGLKFSQKKFMRRFFGATNQDIFKIVFNKKLSQSELKKYSNEKESIYRKVYSPYIKPVKGLKEFLKILKINKIPVVMATSAPTQNVRFVLRKTGLKSFFKKIVDAADVKHGKPNPEIYLKAAQALKINPSLCIAFEDTNPGFKTTKKAGMKVVALTTALPKNKIKNVDQIIKDFTKLSLDQLLILF